MLLLRATRAALAAVLAAVVLAGSAPAEVRAQARTAPAVPTPTPSALLPKTPEAQEAFLREAEVIASRRMGKGVTNPWRLTLRAGGITHDAAFQSVDKRKDEVRFRSGRLERNFRDYYGYNIAAYRLARLLGYDDLVPVTIERLWKGQRGALTWWIDKKWDEDERQKAGVVPPDVPAWEQQLYLARAFTALVEDSDRNLGNQLVTADFHLWLIDFTRAFRLTPELKAPGLLRRVDRRFYKGLKGISEGDLKEALSPWVESPERMAVEARRKALVLHFESIAAERGADRVFYESGSSQEQP